MFTFIASLINRVPRPWNFVVEGAALFLLIGIVFFLLGQVRACEYHRAEEKYKKQVGAISAQQEQLRGAVAERDKAIVALQAKEATVEAVAEQKKRVDDQLAQRIDQVSKEAANEEVVTNADTDCRVRAARMRAKLAGLTPPIVVDGAALEHKLCSQP